METPDVAAAIAIAQANGFIPRRQGSELTFWLPQKLDLPELLDRFQGIAIDAISRHAVGLEHIYLEITQTAMQGMEDNWQSPNAIVTTPKLEA